MPIISTPGSGAVSGVVVTGTASSGMTPVASSGTAGTWKILPGTLLGLTQYAPASLATYNVTAAALAALDTTNLTVSFTVPASQKVLVRATIAANLAATTDTIGFGLLNHSGGAQVGVTFSGGHANVTGTQLLCIAWSLSGLTPGALGLDLAAGAVTAGTCHAFAQGATGNVSGANGGPAVIEVWAQ